MSEKAEKILMAQQETVSPSSIWILFLFLGWSYGSLGKMSTQILFYVTFGGFGVWTLIRLFTLSGAIRSYNNAIYLRYDLKEMIR